MTMTSYAWTIDTDHLAEPGAAPGSNVDNAATVTGPRNASPALLAQLAAGAGRRFRMYDDDQELYYSGRWIGPGWDSDEGGWLDESAFGPLEDFGTPNAGAVAIMYRQSPRNLGSWVQL